MVLALLSAAAITPAAANTDINTGSTVLSTNLSGTGNFNGGTLELSGSTTLSNAFTLQNVATNTIDIHGSTMTLSGAITGSGPLTFVDSAGGGNVTLSNGGNTYTGATTITSGAKVSLSETATLSGTALTDDGIFDISASTTAPSIVSLAGSGSVVLGTKSLTLSAAAGTFSGVISGAGGGIVIASGSETFSGVNTYTGGTTIATGTLHLTASGSLAASSSITANGTFDISSTTGTSIKSLSGMGTVNLGSQTLTITAASGVFSGALTGSGNLVLSGGSETLTGANSFTGTITIASGATLYDGSATIANAIVNNGQFGFYTGATTTMNGVISGAGAVQASGGIITITTAQAYTGRTTITVGTLALSGSGSIATSSGVSATGTFDITNTTGTSITSLSGGGTVNLGAQTLTITNGVATDNFSGVILGLGNVVIAGGNQTFSGNNSFTGTTTISAGTLTVLPGSALTVSRVINNAVLDISPASPTTVATTASIASLGGTGSVTLGSHTLVLSNASDTFSGIISGSGGLTLRSGTETLAGANTYTGTTTISGGTLALSASGSLATTSRVQADGVFDISAATGPTITLAALTGSGTVNIGANTLELANAAGTFSGTIAGTGGLTVSGGTAVLSGANTYSGNSSIASGATLQVGNRGAGGSILGNVADEGTLVFARSDSYAFAGIISGGGALVQNGAGTTMLTATNTYTGGTTITTGTLQIGNAGTTGSILGDVTDNGTLAFGRTDATTFGGVISGTGGVKAVSGTTTLSATNTYTGLTTINSGATLTLTGSIASSSGVADNGTFDLSGAAAPQIKSLSGSGVVTLGGNTLQLTNAAGSFSGVIGGTGGLTLTAGSQILSGANTYSGATTINGGTLTVNGSLASPLVTVNSGGTLSGTGTVAAVTVASGGTLAPGAAVSGTLSVNGPVSFASDSSFVVGVSSTSHTSLSSSAAVPLAGTLTVVSPNGSYTLGQQMTVLTAAGGISGDFTFTQTFASPSGALFSPVLSKDANHLYLEIDLAELTPALPTGATTNQKNAIGGIDAAIAAGSTLPQAFQDLGNLSSAALASDATQFAGEIGTDAPLAGQALFANFLDAVFDHVSDGVRSRRDTDVWLTGFAGSSVFDAGEAITGTHGFKTTRTGVIAGGSFALTPGVTLGAAFSAGSADFHLADGFGTGRTTAMQGAVYGFLRFSPHFYASFAAGAGFDSIKTARVLTVSGTDALAGKANATIYGGRYETGVTLSWATPYIAVQDTIVSLPAYTETATAGANTFALSYASRNLNEGQVELGLRQSYDVEFTPRWVVSPNGRLHLTDKIAWAHGFGGASHVAASFAALAGSEFDVLGAAQDKDAALVSLGAELQLDGGLRVSLHIDSAVSRNTQSYAGMAGIGYTW